MLGFIFGRFYDLTASWRLVNTLVGSSFLLPRICFRFRISRLAWLSTTTPEFLGPHGVADDQLKVTPEFDR